MVKLFREIDSLVKKHSFHAIFIKKVYAVWNFSDFLATQFLREFNYRFSNFDFWEKFTFENVQNSELQKRSKLHILTFLKQIHTYNPFHVNSELQKHSEISKLLCSDFGEKNHMKSLTS